jgi:hypothetical protein
MSADGVLGTHNDSIRNLTAFLPCRSCADPPPPGGHYSGIAMLAAQSASATCSHAADTQEARAPSWWRYPAEGRDMNEQRNLEGISALVAGPRRAAAGQRARSSAGTAPRSSCTDGLQPRFGGDEQLRDGLALRRHVGVHVTRSCLLVGAPTRDKPTVTLTTQPILIGPARSSTSRASFPRLTGQVPFAGSPGSVG